MLNNFDAATFMQDYWQKQPLLIRQAFPGFTIPFSPDELAGLACEGEVESRIIRELPSQPYWQLQHGPFDEDIFSHLPETHWTLLVQEMNRHVPELAMLLDHFSFLPGWRVDDVMVSYAPQHGSVGPHTDEYDVFLLQAKGHRKWMINCEAYQPDDFLPDLPLKILREFTTSDEWVLEPGDILYLPPGVAHHGVALDDCMTFSIGLRAPSHSEILTAFVDDLAIQLDEAHRYRDPEQLPAANSGEIDDHTIDNIRAILMNYTGNRDIIRNWFGRYVTQQKHDADTAEQQALSVDEFNQLLKQCESMYRSEEYRFNYYRGDQLEFYVDGELLLYPASHLEIIRLLCNQRQIACIELSRLCRDRQIVSFLTELTNKGYLYFDE